MKPPRPLADRFWEKVDRKSDGECWEWMGTRTQGYGVMSVFGRGGSGLDKGHRISWALANGRAVPDGMWVLHHCDNRGCVNPAHLYVGTRAQNIRDAVERGRTKVLGEHLRRRTECPKGHPYTGDNLIIQRGHRLCKECRHAGWADWYARNRERQLERKRQARLLAKEKHG